MSPSPAAPWLLCWQGLLASEATSRLRKLLPQLAGGMLCALLLVLPMATRTGLGLLIAACGLLWLKVGKYCCCCCETARTSSTKRNCFESWCRSSHDRAPNCCG